MSMLLTEISVKELEILKEALPNATRVGVLWNPTTPSHPTAVSAVEVASAKPESNWFWLQPELFPRFSKHSQ